MVSIEFETFNVGATKEVAVHMDHYMIAINSAIPSVRTFQEVPEDIVKILTSRYGDQVRVWRNFGISRDHTKCCKKPSSSCKSYDRIQKPGNWIVLVWSKHFKPIRESKSSAYSMKNVDEELGRRISNWVFLGYNDNVFAISCVHFQVPNTDGYHKKTKLVMGELINEVKDFNKMFDKVVYPIIMGDFNTLPEALSKIHIDKDKYSLIGMTDKPTNLCSKTGRLLRLDYILSFNLGLKRVSDEVLPKEPEWDHSQLRSVF